MDGGLVIAEVVAGSTAAEIGLVVGDRLVAVNDHRIRNTEDLRAALSGLRAGDRIAVTVRRDGMRRTFDGTLGPRPPEEGTSQLPLAAPAPAVARGVAPAPAPAAAAAARPRGELGIVVVEREGAVVIDELPRGSAAAAAGVRTGDRIARVDGKAMGGIDALAASLAMRRAGDRVALTIERDGRSIELRVTLSAGAGAETTATPVQGNAKPAPEAAIVDPPGDPSGDAPPVHLGLEVEERDDGLWIVGVDSGAPAAAAGLRVGDRVLEIAGMEITDLDAMRRAIAALRGDARTAVTVWRGGRAVRHEVDTERR
jgi:S1-C subfamily serine protease